MRLKNKKNEKKNKHDEIGNGVVARNSTKTDAGKKMKERENRKA